MKDVLRRLAARPEGCVASWQLRRADWSWDAIRHRTRDLRRLHDGVFVTGDAPVTRLQRWWAATLTAPGMSWPSRAPELPTRCARGKAASKSSSERGPAARGDT